MRAIVQQRYGGVDQLELRDDVPTPTPGKGEVLVRVRAAGVDRGTEHLMTGEPLLMRLALGVPRAAAADARARPGRGRRAGRARG
jgi:D-arabinose 1-dehydrogenase-like Zn-dependent alcohol dehydrogenase